MHCTFYHHCCHELKKEQLKCTFLFYFLCASFSATFFTSASLCENPNSSGMKVKLSFHLQGVWQDIQLGRHIFVCLCSSPSSQLKCNPAKSKCCTWVYPCVWLFQGGFWDTCREISLCSIVCDRLQNASYSIAGVKRRTEGVLTPPVLLPCVRSVPSSCSQVVLPLLSRRTFPIHTILGKEKTDFKIILAFCSPSLGHGEEGACRSELTRLGQVMRGYCAGDLGCWYCCGKLEEAGCWEGVVGCILYPGLI